MSRLLLEVEEEEEEVEEEVVEVLGDVTTDHVAVRGERGARWSSDMAASPH